METAAGCVEEVVMSDMLEFKRRGGDRDTASKRIYTAWTNGIGAMVARSLVVVIFALCSVIAWGATIAASEFRDWMREMSGDIKDIKTDINGMNMKILELQNHDRLQEALQQQESGKRKN